MSNVKGVAHRNEGTENRQSAALWSLLVFFSSLFCGPQILLLHSKKEKKKEIKPLCAAYPATELKGK